MDNLNIFFNKNHEMILNNDVSLQAITSKVVDYMNGLINREKELLEMFNALKNDTNKSIADLNKAITDFINTENSNYLTFEQEILDSLVEYKNETDKEISAKSLEVDNALNNIDLTNEVASYFTSQLSTNYFTNLYNNTKSVIYNLVYYGNAPTTYPQFTYYYNSSTDTLYYNKQVIEPTLTCLYYYNNSLYMCVSENGKKVLRKVVIPNE